MAEALWKKLIELAHIDNSLSAITDQITTLHDSITEKRTQITELTEKPHTYETRMRELQKKLRRIEHDLSELDAREREKKEHMETISNPRAYDALQKEMTTLTLERQDYEDALLETMNTLETTEKKFYELAAHNKDRIQEITTDIDNINQHIAELNQKHQTVYAQRNECVEAIPSEWRNRYKQMKNRVSDPIVSIINNQCGSCFYRVLPQDVLRLKKGAVLYCRNCYRFLYYQEPAEQS